MIGQIVIWTIVIYSLSLIYITKATLKKSRIEVSLFFATTIFIRLITWNLRILVKSLNNRVKFWERFKSFLLEYPISVIILGEIIYNDAKRYGVVSENESVHVRVKWPKISFKISFNDLKKVLNKRNLPVYENLLEMA